MPEVTLEGRPLKIFPVRGRKPACTHGFKDATADPAGIAALFDNARGAQIAVATGEVNDLDILDVDPRRDGHKWLEENRHRIPQTRTHHTPSGGWHLLFRHAEGLRGSYDRIAPGIEVKATGGLVVWWPAQSHPVQDAPVATWPEWLLELARKPEPFIGGAGGGPHFFNATSSDGWMIPNVLWSRLKAATPRASDHDRYRMRGLLRTVVQKPEGGQNNALNWSAYHFREWIDCGAISREDAERLLLEAARWSGYVERDGIADTVATICSGLGA
jgi:hypothetical protein